MNPTLCSRCKKNVAVVYITRLDGPGQEAHNEGLCLKCARELNIRPVTDMIDKMGLSDEDLEGLTKEMIKNKQNLTKKTIIKPTNQNQPKSIVYFFK